MAALWWCDKLASYGPHSSCANLLLQKTIAYITLYQITLRYFTLYLRKLLQYIILHCIASEKICSNLLHQKIISYITLC